MKIGILGNGQLGMMLGQAGLQYNATATGAKLEISCYAPEKKAPASHACVCVEAAYEDSEALHSWISAQDVISYEFENIPQAAITVLKEFPGKISPQVIALETMQNRIREKDLARANGAKTAEYQAFDQADPQQKLALLKTYFETKQQPLILKTASFGYDGKGQAVIHSSQDVEACLPLLQQTCIAEHFVPFETEVSLISCRGTNGEIRHYPLAENFHREGILRVSRALAPAVQKLQSQAETIAEKILANLRYVGIMTIEFFVIGEELYINEFAPRVHNSGHWTIEGSETSQFENHLRAIAGLPLGSTQSKPSLLFNLIGNLEYDKELLRSGTFHTYYKENRANRKVGHVTVVEDRFDRLPEISTLLTAKHRY